MLDVSFRSLPQNITRIHFFRRKPQFALRSMYFAKIHALMTSTLETQLAFAKKYEALLVFACMEYVTRVTTMYMPAEYEFLRDMGAMTCFFERVPLMCDEYRQTIEETKTHTWESLNKLADTYVEKVTRLKRRQKLARREPGCVSLSPDEIHSCMDLPIFRGIDPAEYGLASQSLGIPPDVLSHIQHLLVVRPLPANLGAIQCKRLLESLKYLPGTTARQLYMQTRMHVCPACMSQKSASGRVFRLDTLTQRLICASCFSDQILSVDLLGRTVQARSTTYYMCPSCLTLQTYHGTELMWSAETCNHQPRGKHDAKKIPRTICDMCDDNATPAKWDRIDFATGKLETIRCCQRHCPSWEESKYCTNTRQMAKLARLKDA
jgi:hypothetical protein